MKPASALALASLLVTQVVALSTSKSWTGLTSSTFTARPRGPARRRRPLASSTLTMYEPSPGTDKNDVWSALTLTEKWISDSVGEQKTNSPYVRKDVSYVCETSDDMAMIVSDIFRRVRESREIGENHGVKEEQEIAKKGSSYSPKTLRKTYIMVIPSNEDLLDSFPLFDQIIEEINHTRRHARDYVTDLSLEKVNEELEGNKKDRDWVVSINVGHLHPKYGQKSPEQVWKEMEKEEDEQEVDVNLLIYQERRMKARQSPFPSVVIEVRATPPPDYDNASPKYPRSTQEEDKKRRVTAEDILKLEAAFGKPASFDHPARQMAQEDNDDAFYASIGKAIGGEEITSLTPMEQAQHWISANFPSLDPQMTAFTSCDVRNVDAAHEFVFANIAMLKGMSYSAQYIAMPNFISNAAGSFTKFSMQVADILAILPGFKNVHVSILHPEHVDSARRCPVPVFVIEEKKTI